MLDKTRKNQLKKFQNITGCKFKKIHLLNQALTHKSFINESKSNSFKDNERMEFLGDAVLGLVISDYIYSRFSDKDEGFLSKLRANLVNKQSLLDIAKAVNLGSFLILGKGEGLSGGRALASNLTASLEALIGALFLDRGFQYTRKIIINLFKEQVEKSRTGKLTVDYKSIFQEYALKKFKVVPAYRVISEAGPGHKKEFEIEAGIKDVVCGRAKGYSKKSAQQEAAKNALIKLDMINRPNNLDKKESLI